jgi:hypothetical protein
MKRIKIQMKLQMKRLSRRSKDHLRDITDYSTLEIVRDDPLTFTACYMNSFLQALYQIKEFREDLLSIDDSQTGA